MDLKYFSKLPNWVTAERAKNLLVVFILLWMASRLASYFWVVMSPVGVNKANLNSQKVAGASMSSQQPKASVSLTELKNLAIFGEGPKDAEGVAKKKQPIKTTVTEGNIPYDAPKSRLPLVLTGLVSGGDSRLSTAMLKYQSTEDSYNLNDKLPPNKQAVLKRVLSDRVIIRNAGRYESLILYDGLAPKSAPKTNRNTLKSKKQASALEPVSSDKREAAVGKLRDMIQSRDAQAIQKIVGVTVARGVNGEIKGYKVFPGQDKDMFYNLGFQKDDIITSVNGVALNDPSKMTEAMSGFTSGGEIKLSVEQGGATREVSFSL